MVKEKEKMEEGLIKKQQNRSQQIKFVREVLTPMNPKDMFYYNMEQRIQTYMIFALIGLGMVLYMVIY